MVFADACDTAQTGLELAGEQLGFPTGFLAVGASSVVASFYPVSDFSNALLMERVHELVHAGKRIVPALQTAASELRRMPRETVLARLAAAHDDIDEALRAQADLTAHDRTRLLSVHTTLKRWTENIAAGGDIPFSHPFFWAAFAPHGSNR